MSADLPAGGLPAGSLISSLLAFAALGGGASLLYRALPAAIGALARQCLVTVEVRNEEVFAWVADWIGQLSYGSTCRLLAVGLLRLRTGDVTGRKPLLIFAPGRGMHLFRYRSPFLWLRRGLQASAGPSQRAGCASIFRRWV